jgi:hypothetical protein
MKVDVKYVRSNELEDIYSYRTEEGKLEYTKFPRTMEMTVREVYDYIN